VRNVHPSMFNLPHWRFLLRAPHQKGLCQSSPNLTRRRCRMLRQVRASSPLSFSAVSQLNLPFNSALCVGGLLRASLVNGLGVPAAYFLVAVACAATLVSAAASGHPSLKKALPVGSQLRCCLHLAAVFSCIFQPPTPPWQLPAIFCAFVASAYRQARMPLFHFFIASSFVWSRTAVC
jgi:hypothetical protein